jgi:hypothetical protein
MYFADKEIEAIRRYLANIDRADRSGCRRNYISNQVRNIRLLLSRAERREKNTLL